jgi:anti-sigma factor RsiW
MPEPRPLSETEEAQLAAFADGQLSDEERADFERRLAADADLARAYARQRAGIVTIAAAVESVSAPLALRSRVEAMQRGESPARRRRRFGLPSWLPVAAIATVTAVAIAALVLVGGAPSTSDVVAAALRPPTAAVSLDPRQPALLRDRVEAVRFPNFLAKFGWEATGVRTDEIGGRTVRTVFYRKEGRRIAYSVISGEALDFPGDAAKRPTDGIDTRTFQSGNRTVVTWRRDGQTCVLSGVNVPLDELLTLAAWKGQGAVTF